MIKPLALAALALAVIHAHAQDTLRSTTNLVLVPTMVLSGTGEMVGGLGSKDFILTDNGIPQEVAVEHIEHQPVAIVVLMQTGGTAPGMFPQYKGLGTMLDNLVGETKHKVALVTFDSQPEELWNFPPRGDGLSYAFTHPEPGDGGAAMLDAVIYSINLLKQQPDAIRRIILLIGEQHDHGSRIKPEEVVRQLGESNTTIYSLAFSPTKKWVHDQFAGNRQEAKPYDMPGQPQILHTFSISEPLMHAYQGMQADTASEVAALSGGEVFHFSNRKDLEESLALLSNRIPNRYTLSFRPTSKEPGFHALKVGVVGHTEPMTVSARSSYWSK